MATPPNDDTKTLFKLLADGKWHLYEELREQIASSIPPGRALRKYQERIEYKRKYTGDPSYDTDLSEDERIFYGARACAQIVITTWKGKGIDFTGTAENKSIRRKPGFTTWGIEALPDDPEEAEPAGGSPGVPPGDSVPSEGGAAGLVAEASVRGDEGLEEAEPEPVILIPTVEWVPDPEPGKEPVASSPSVAERGCPACGWRVLEEVERPSPPLAQSEENGRADMALFSESEIRHLVEEVVAKLLDEFQVGMQGYLGTQFAQLEASISALTGKPWRVSKGPPFGAY